MAMPCSTCAHAKREQIDRALVSGQPNRRIATQFGLSEASVRRHWPHIRRAAARAEAIEVAHGSDLLERMEGLYDRAIGLLERAERSHNFIAITGGIRETRAILELLMRANGELIPYAEFVHGRDMLIQIIVKHVNDRTVLAAIQRDINELRS